MYTNTNGAKGAEKRAKLLAAIGVLIVAIAAVALVVPTASGATEASTAETADLDVFTLTYNDQELDVGVSDTSVTITGFASVNAGTGVTYVGIPEIKISNASSSSYKYSVNGGTVTDITSTATAISGLSAGESFTVVVYSAYTSATDNTVYKTFTLDCSGVATQVVLASSEASGSGTSGTWSYDGEGTLTLSSYTGDLIFYRANDLTVKLVGNNVMNVQGHADDSVGGHGSGAIRASGTLTIVSGATDSTVPTLTVNQNIDGTFGLWAKSITIGDASSTAKNITITTTGGNRGIYTTGDVNIYNATVNVEGSERAIRFGSSGTLNIDNSNVIAILDGTATTNGGTDDLYGIKGGSIDVDDKSKVTTDGMFLAGTYTNAGVVIVSGDYTQNCGAGVEYQIAGLYLSSEDAVSNLVRVANSTSATTAGYTYLVDGAIVYIGSAASYTVTYGTSKEVYFNKVSEVTADITAALAGTVGTDACSAVVLYTAAPTVSSMDLTVVSGVELRIVTPTSTETDKKGEPTGTYSGTITAALTSSSTSTSVVTLTAVSGNFTVNYGSVELAGIITGTSIAVTTGDAVLAADSIVEVTTITVAKNTTLDIEGTVGKTDSAMITTTINNSGSITLGDNCNISKAGIVNDDTGSVDSSTYAENVNISGGILRTSTFEVDQNVTITGDVTISGIVTVQGTLTINSGVTVTIATGGQLILSGGAAILNNNGTITVNAAATTGAVYINDGTVNNAGTITFNAASGSTGSVFVTSASSHIANSGSIAVSAGSVSLNGTLTNTGVLQLGGTVAAATGTINNSGAVTVSGTVSTVLTITQTVDGAAVAISNVTITSTSAGIVVQDSSSCKVGVATEVANSVVTGLTVIYDYTAATTTAEAVHNLDISGTVAVGSTTQSAIIGLTGNVSVDDSLALGAYVTLVNTSIGVLTVEGTLSAAANAAITNEGKITVTGTLSYIGTAVLGGTVNAAYYTIETAATTTTAAYVTYYYTTVASAVASGATSITAVGENTISADLTVPAGVTLTNSGTAFTVSKDATLTFADGSYLVNTGNTITVNGVLVLEDYTDYPTTLGTISADVRTVDGNEYTYSYLAYALSNAASGDTVVLLKSTEITEAATINGGVTLDAGSYTLTIKGCALTVNGTLSIADLTKVVYSMGDASNGSIVLNGTIEYTSTSTTLAIVDGGYYQIGAKYYIKPVQDALDIINTTEGDTVTIRGTSSTITLGTITATGESSSALATVVIVQPTTIGSITLTNAQLTLTNGSGATYAVNATVNNTDGDSIVLAGSASRTTGLAIVDTAGAMTISGNYAGTATIAGTVTTANTVSAASTIWNVVVNGTLAIGDSCSLDAYVSMTVMGTLTASGNGVTAGNMFVGYSVSDDVVTIGTGTVTGTVSVDGYAIVSAASSVPTGITGANYNVTYYVNDAKYATLYSEVSTPIATVEPNNTSGAFVGWYTSAGAYMSGSSTSRANTNISVYANIVENAYKIVVQAATGVADVYINGTLMTYGQVTDEDGNIYYAYFSYVSAGTYSITYTLLSGYVDNNSSSTISVTCSGAVEAEYDASGYTITYDTTTVSITNIGVASQSSDSGMGLTDYLLIILVVLIAVMAIIIAVRLMRS